MTQKPNHPVAPSTARTPHPQLRFPPGPSRCFPFWQELLACYVVNTDTGDMSGGRKCLPALEDYYECLHHKKEVRQSRSTCPARPWLSSEDADLGGFMVRRREQGHYSTRTEGQKPRTRERMRRRRARLGVWDCWTGKRIRRKC